jgi:hypothetical protein
MPALLKHTSANISITEPHLQERWKAFSAFFTQNGGVGKQEVLALFEDFIFGDDTAKGFTGDDASRFAKLKAAMNEAGASLGAFANDKQNHSFVQYMQELLYDKWLASAQEERHYPFDNTRRLGKEEADDPEDARVQALRSKSCAMLSDSIYQSMKGLLKMKVVAVHPKFADFGISRDDVGEHAFYIFRSCLFRYAKKPNLNFAHFVSHRLDYDLAREVYQDCRRDTVSLDAVKPGSENEDENLLARIENAKESEDRTRADAIEHAQLVVKGAAAILSNRDFAIMALYQGLDGEPALTMAQIGKLLDLSESRVSQLHDEVLGRLREELPPILERISQIRDKRSEKLGYVASLKAAASARLQERSANPAQAQNKPSLSEMIDDAYTHHDNFHALIFNRLLPTWDMSGKAFARHLEAVAGADCKISDSSISNWNMNADMKPVSETVEFLARTFKLDEQRTLKLYKIARGGWIPDLDALIESAEAQNDHTALIVQLTEAAGLPRERNPNYYNCAKGSHFRDVEATKKFLKELNPEFSGVPDVVTQQNLRMLSLLTGRVFDIDHLLQTALMAPNPGGKLLSLLTGRSRGVTHISNAEMAATLSTPDDAVSVPRVEKMCVGTVKQPGSAINERQAGKILAMVQERSELKFTPEQCKKGVDILTGIGDPHSLLEQAWKKKITVSDLLKLTRKRWDITQAKAEQASGVADLTVIEQDNAPVNHVTARKLAKWLGYTEGRDLRRFSLLAMHTDLSQTPDQLLDQAKAGILSRQEALTRLYDMTAMTRSELGRVCHTRPRAIEYSVTLTGTGRIPGTEEELRRVAATCGLTHRAQEFIEHFKGRVLTRSEGREPLPGRG